MNAPTTTAEWLTTVEVGKEIRKSADYVAKLCKAKQIKAKKLGNDWRISRAALEEFMAGGVAAPARERPELTARQQKRAS